jgi:hypothetical protein
MGNPIDYIVIDWQRHWSVLDDKIQSWTFCLLICCLRTFNIRIYKTVIFPVVLYGWNLVYDIKGEQVAEEIEVGWSDRRVEKTA